MGIFAIGDLHFSFGTNKPMDIFGGWKNHEQRIRENWLNAVSPDDTVVLVGDTSWAMSLEEALPDFEYIESLPGKKIIIKGNHDYWWTTKKKIDDFFARHNLKSLNILNNNSYSDCGVGICGSRGWMFEDGDPQNAKILAREAARLDRSLASSTEAEKLAFIHYPPVFCDFIAAGIIDVLLKHGVKRCYYGHLHGESRSLALNGKYMGINFGLISGDNTGFTPVKVK